MKKLKSLLCFAFIIFASCISFAGCGNENQDEPITLADAKTLIVNALESDLAETVAISSNPSSKKGNRNVFVTLGNIQLTLEGNFDYDKTISGYVQRRYGSWTKFSLESDNYFEYFDGENVYQKNDTLSQTTTFDSSYFGLILNSIDCVYVDLLFIEDAWTTIYKDNTTKKHSKTGYSLIMDIDMPSYVDYVMSKAEEKGIGSEGLFGEGEYLQKNKEEGNAELAVSFDKHNKIIGLELAVTSLASSDGTTFFTTTKIKAEKYNEQISAPEWFNTSDF